MSATNEPTDAADGPVTALDAKITPPCVIVPAVAVRSTEAFAAAALLTTRIEPPFWLMFVEAFSVTNAEPPVTSAMIVPPVCVMPAAVSKIAPKTVPIPFAEAAMVPVSAMLVPACSVTCEVAKLADAPLIEDDASIPPCLPCEIRPADVLVAIR